MHAITLLCVAKRAEKFWGKNSTEDVLYCFVTSLVSQLEEVIGSYNFITGRPSQMCITNLRVSIKSLTSACSL